jgi:hypothetical protein
MGPYPGQVRLGRGVITAASSRYTDAQKTIWSRRAMTPDELRAIPAVLGLSRAHLAKLLSRSPRCISHWTVGDRPLPYEVGILLQLLVARKITVRDVEEAAAAVTPVKINGGAEPGLPAPRLVAPAPEPAVIDRNQTLAEKVLALTGCRWPHNDPRHPDFFFCNAAVIEPPYCPRHRDAAHMPQPSSKTVSAHRPGFRPSGSLAPAGVRV